LQLIKKTRLSNNNTNLVKVYNKSKQWLNYLIKPSGNLPVSLLKPTRKWLKLQFIDWPHEAWSKSESNLYLPHVKMPNFTAGKKCLQPGAEKLLLVYIANSALHDNCEGGNFF